MGGFPKCPSKWYYIATLFYLAFTTHAAVLPMPAISIYQAPSNASENQPGQDILPLQTLGNNPRFSISLGFGDRSLRPISILMNGVHAVHSLATRSIRSRIPAELFHIAAYPDVEFTLRPMGGESDTLTEVALLCIFQATVWVARTRQYKNLEADCMWDNRIVAQLNVDPTGITRGSKATSLTLEDAEANSKNNETAAATTLGATSARFVYSQDAQPFTMEDVFMTGLAVLKACAYKPPEDTVPTYTKISAEWSRAFMLFEPATIRSRPPYFEWRAIIEMIPQMMYFLVRSGRYAELGMQIYVDNALVGQGLLDREPPSDAVSDA
ncbi:MAG: hypothetical protein Q9219_007183 [cf. Caloplaca sp. 3 TL-2023]